jgi:hypothetical protein
MFLKIVDEWSELGTEVGVVCEVAVDVSVFCSLLFDFVLEMRDRVHDVAEVIQMNEGSGLFIKSSINLIIHIRFGNETRQFRDQCEIVSRGGLTR